MASESSHAVIVAPGFAPRVVTVQPSTDQERRSRTVQLHPGVSCQILVTDTNGHPADGVGVRANLASGPGRLLPLTRRNRVTLGQTDQDGRLTLESFWTEETTFHVHHPELGVGSARWEPAEAGLLRITIRPRAIVRGTVTSDGHDASQIRWHVTLTPKPEYGEARDVLSGDGGTFEFGNVGAGQYGLSVRSPETGRGGGNTHEPRHVVIVGGEVVHFDLSVDKSARRFGPSLSGRIRRNGVDAGGLLVEFRATAAQPDDTTASRVRTDAFGQFGIYLTNLNRFRLRGHLEIRSESFGRPILIARFPIERGHLFGPIDIDIPSGAIEVGLGMEEARRMFRLNPLGSGRTIPSVLLVANRFGVLRAENFVATEYEVVRVDFDTIDRHPILVHYGPVTIPQGDVLVDDLVLTRREEVRPATSHPQMSRSGSPGESPPRRGRASPRDRQKR